MLGKSYNLGAYVEGTQEARVKLANFDYLATQGGTIADFITSFTPDSKYMYLHVIAMGAGEYYGCNINGDYFPERDLIAKHQTFTENAHVFKEHDNKPTSQAYGNVVFSWYNRKMHRVELILAIDKDAGREFVDRVNRGEQLEVSMGCRVKYDVCSICGNKAHKKNEYCDHIRYELKKVYPDGRQAYMINVNPTFFDISIVKHRADRIAYVLDKVASADEENTSYPASEAKSVEQIMSEIHDVDEAVLNKQASVSKQADIDKRIAAASVHVLNEEMLHRVAELNAIEPDLPVALLDRLAIRFPLASILHSAALNAIQLRPKEVTRIIVIQQGLPISRSAEVLQGILHTKPASHIQDVPYDYSIAKLLDPYIAYRSSFLSPLMTRLQALVLQKHASVDTTLPGVVYDMDPALHLGQVRTPVTVDQLSNNVYMQPATYPRDGANTKNTTPLTPMQTGAMLGAAYMAYKNGALENILQDPKKAFLFGMLSMYAAGKVRDDIYDGVLAKANGLVKSACNQDVTPIVWAHYLGAGGTPYSNESICKFASTNIDLLGATALFLSQPENPTKLAALNTDKQVDAQLERLAEFLL